MRYNLYMKNILIREIPEHDRPRERMARLGPAGLTDAELLAILIRTGKRGMSAVQLGDALIRRFGSLEELARRSISEIAGVPGVGRVKAGLLKAAFALHERVQAGVRERAALDTPAKIYDYMFEKVRFLNVEVLYGLSLNAKLKLIRCEEISRGLLNQTLVHAREVYREAIASSAAHLLLVHNHPSGDPSPSSDDIQATKQLADAGRILGIPLVDHVIIGRPHANFPNGYASLRQLGWISTSSDS